MKRPDEDIHDPELSRLYRELPDHQPGNDTDAAILAAARRAVQAGPRRHPKFTASRITATAAALVLGVALTVQWQHEEPERLREVLATTPGTQAQPSPEAADMAPATAAPRVAAPARRETTTPEQEALATPAEPPASPASTGASDAVADAEKPEAPVVAMQRKQEAAEADGAAPSKAAEAVASVRREESRRSAEAEAPTVARKHAPTAPQASAASPLPDYRTAMTAGRLEEALALLPATETPVSMLDRDLLQAATGAQVRPACAQLTPPLSGSDGLLCELLQQRAAGLLSPAGGRERLEAAGALSGETAYRSSAVERIWGRPAR